MVVVEEMMNGILITMVTECKKLVFSRNQESTSLYIKEVIIKEKKVIFYERERKDMKIELPFHKKTLEEQKWI